MAFSKNSREISSALDTDGDNNTTTVYNIPGDNNLILALGNPEKKKESSMYSLLNNIEEMYTLNAIDELDTTPYCIQDKIEHNKLHMYGKFYDGFQEDSYVIDQRIKFIEQNSNANFGSSIISYVRSKYRQVYISEPNYTNEKILIGLQQLISLELKNYYGNSLSPEELSYVPVVIFYVFKHCKIFEKP